MSKETNESQYDKLRKRLEEELSLLKSSTDTNDYDWFLRGHLLNQTNSNLISQINPNTSSNDKSNGIPLTTSITPTSPLKSPSMANSNNNKALPTLSTSNKKDNDLLVGLSRSRTADAKLTTPISRSSTNSSSINNIALHKTATNIETSDIGRSRNSKKVYIPPIVNKTPLSPPTPQKKKGFLKKLFGSKSEDSKPEMNIYKSSLSSNSISTPTPTPTPNQSPTPPLIPSSPKATNFNSNLPLVSKTISRNDHQSDIGSDSSSKISESATTSISSIPLSSSTTKTLTKTSINSLSPSIKNNTPSTILYKNFNKLTLADQYKDIDPQLSAYIKEIENFNLNSTNNDNDNENIININNNNNNNNNDIIDYNFIYSPMGLDSIKYNDDEIPAHPDTPKLPSALSSNPRFGGSLEKELFLKQKKDREERESSMFGSLLHKTKTNNIDNYLFNGMLNESEDTPPFNFEPLKYNLPPPKPIKTPPLKTLNILKPMKKVAFASTTFVTDPPQQIPSRNPRKGNVEICPNGELIIHKIDPQEKINSATGIVVGGSGHLRLINEDTTNNTENMNIDIPNAPTMSKTASSISITSNTSSMDQTIKNEDRALAAKKAREQHSNEDIDIQKEGLKIDKPMIKRRKQMEKPIVTLKMDELYTRCCHLREILPIPATLKQIPKGSIDPIPYIHLRNPRPSMIEILSFTDFIRIAPVICVSLDGVSLTREMFRIILSSLLYKRYLEKLSLRNTSIDEEGWKMLSLFLSMNKALKKLDITQCPSLDVNTQRIKKKSKTVIESRMTCNINDRSDRNWALLTASIIIRGGIDDIVLTGCKIPDLKLFSNLLNLALIKTHRIGLAYNELTSQHCYVIARWLENNSNIIGIDLAYNDLSSILKPLTEYANSDNNDENNLTMLSLNSCNLIDCEDIDEFFNSLSKLPNLKYLDLSSNIKLFKTFLTKLAIYLPLFHNLARLNLDYNNLDTKSMVTFLECIPLIPNLNYLSITGNSIDEIVAISLCKALKNSNSLYSIDFDKSFVSSEIQERIGLLTMRNVERQLYRTKGEFRGVNQSLIDIISTKDRDTFRKELGLDENISFIELLYKVVNSNTIDTEVVDKFLQVVLDARLQLKAVIQELMNSNLKNELSLQGKELLIKLCAMDASINKAFELINNKKLNLIKDKTITDLQIKNYDELLRNSFEQGSNKDLTSLIENFKSNPSIAKQKLKDYMLQSNDPYDLFQLLQNFKHSDIKISDLFNKLKSCQKPSSEPIHTIDDDASIDSAEFDIPLENEDEHAGEPGNEKIQQIYDLILKDLVKRA
jgi:hypothetical protein